MTILKRDDLVFPELSYKIVGLMFDVYNELGYGYHEKYYQRAIAENFLQNGVRFNEQVFAPLIFKEKIVGKFFLDFLIEDKMILEIKKDGRFSKRHDKMILEIKKDGRFSKRHIDQVNNYLKTSGLRLALLVNFGRDGVKFKRLVNLS